MLANNETYLKMINLILEAYNEKEINIEKSEVNLYTITNQIIQELKPIANNKNITIKNNLKENFTILVDFLCINRILMNLISNSIENIEREKTITISGKQNQSYSQIIIEDNGSGIEANVLSTIFEKYHSSNKSGKKTVSGLGLYIVKDLVTKNSGNINVESEIGAYTRFIIKLPNKGLKWKNTI